MEEFDFFWNVTEFLRGEGWEEKSARRPGRHSYSDKKLWMPPFVEGCNFFSDFGIIFGFFGFRDPPYKWVRVKKKIFKNNEAYRSWESTITESVREKSEQIIKEKNKLKKKYVAKHKLKDRRAKYNYEFEPSEKLEKLTKELEEFEGGCPDVVLHSHKVYYLCYYVDIEEVMNNAENSALLDTIIFNLEKLR